MVLGPKTRRGSNLLRYHHAGSWRTPGHPPPAVPPKRDVRDGCPRAARECRDGEDPRPDGRAGGLLPRDTAPDRHPGGPLVPVRDAAGGQHRRTLDLLDECGARATFFVLGWVADAAPELVREVVARGHEVASKGYYHRDLRELAREAFRDDAVRAREALERAPGAGAAATGWRRTGAARRTMGARGPGGCGYRVRLERATVAPDLCSRAVAAVPLSDDGCAVGPSSRFPSPRSELFGMHVPIAGGNYFRQFPHALVRRAVAHWDRALSGALRDVLPHLGAGPGPAADQRQSPAPADAPVPEPAQDAGLVRHYLETYRFTSVAEYFELTQREPRRWPVARTPRRSARASRRGGLRADGRRSTAVSGRGALLQRGAVPAATSRTRCAASSAELADRYRLELRLRGRLQHRPHLGGAAARSSAATADCQFCPARTQPGVAAAIQTGIAHAEYRDRVLDGLRLHLRSPRARSG